MKTVIDVPKVISSAMPSVAIVLLNWNSTDDTLACIESIRKLTYENCQVVVIDNASRSTEYHALRSGCADELILRQKRNLGFAGGCNAGIRWALENGFEYVWLLNNDTVVAPESLAELVRAMQSDPRIGIVGGIIYYWNDPERIQTAGGFIDPETGRGGMLGVNELDAGQFRDDFDVEYASGGMSLVRVGAIREVGLLDERFFMYYEDTDWGLRMRARDWRVITASSAKTWHKDKATAGNRKPYFIEHGYFMFLYKNSRHNLPHALRLYARHYVRPHLERHQWRLAWADAQVYLKFVSRLALVRPNLQP